MSSTVISNPVTSSDRSKRKKKKKSSQPKDQKNPIVKWKSETQQQIYSSKLIQALNQVTISQNSSPSAPRGGRAVREAADRVLAVAAKGRSRWSRAILTNRLKLKFRKQKKPQKVPAPSSSLLATGSGRSKKTRFSVLRLKNKSLPTVQRKVRVLGRLVPGCRKQPLPVILDEASDYIAALEMQVRAMKAIAELFSGISGSGSGGSSSSSSSSSSSAAPPPTS
ncbi:transcription factor bHLH147 [Mangifera indica]|uniref:transcription factor bHLH147 n=1 Tax=Mangifera indica TaxID=29780 RepID=UPI001CFA9129|nr:transcription factor bHLH147 [Mangifera indica]